MARRPRAQRAPRTSRIDRRTAALCVLCAAVIVLYAILVPVQIVFYGTPLPLSFILGAMLCVAPLLAIERPRWAIALFCGAAFTLPLIIDADLATNAPWPWSVPALLTFFLLIGVVTFAHGAALGAFPLIIGTILSLTAPLLRPDVVSTSATAGSATADLIVTASVAAAVFVITTLVAGRMRVSAELTREREHSALEQSRRALVEERTRIARELHDVVAHSMSVVQVQASTARYRLPDIGEEAAAEFDSIAATARSSLTEMRRMLGVLRTEDQSAELAPQHGIDDIPALVDGIRRAGADVGLAIDGAPAAVPPSVQIASFRIVQEALSNAMRHAPDAPIRVRLHAGHDAVRITVQNPVPTPASAPTGSGYGLRGMRERVGLLGGTFSAGPDRDGGWFVEAEIPLSAEPITARDRTDEETP